MEKHISNSIHPGEILREDIINAANLSVTEAASFLGISRLSLSKILNGRGNITPNIALRLEKVFGGKAEFWLRMQRTFDLEMERKNFLENPPELKKFVYH